MPHNVPARVCANHPKCSAIIPANVGTLHCEECHRTDPELIVAASDYRMRQRARERSALGSTSPPSADARGPVGRGVGDTNTET